MKNHLQEIIAGNISKEYGFDKEDILCFFDKREHINCLFPYAAMVAIQKSLGAESLRDILTEFECDNYLLDDELKPVPLRKDEFIIRDNSFSDLGIEQGDIIKYDPDEVGYEDYQAVELDGVILPAYVASPKNGVCELYYEDGGYEHITVFADKIRFLGKLIGYRKPDEFYFRDFYDYGEEFEADGAEEPEY